MNQQSFLFKNNNNSEYSTEIIVKSKKIKTTPVYNEYWKFAYKRQEIFFSRQKNNQGPWLKDNILNKYKFTNAYRASDRVSQYLIRNVIYKGEQTPREVFFRCILFKLFNKIETWELLVRAIGDLTFEDYRFENYDRVLTKAMNLGEKIYSAAYIMPSRGIPTLHNKKHRMHLELVEKMINDNLPEKINESSSLEEVYNLLISYPGIGSFLAFQYAIDLNYSNIINFSEMDFVVAGPGAKNGIKKCFIDTNNLSCEDIIKYMTDSQEYEFNRLGLNFKSLWGRNLQLIDCQNLFCEIDKYSRVKFPELSAKTGRTKIKQQFRQNLDKIQYFYPPKWGINSSICEEMG